METCTFGEITLKFCDNEVDLPLNTLYTFRAKVKSLVSYNIFHDINNTL